MEQIIGACGLICSDCEAYKATQANDAEFVARVAEQWCKEYGADIKPEAVWCDGCMTDSSRKCGHCGECKTRACALDKGINNCAECTDYPCEHISSFFEMVPKVKETLDGLRANL